MSISSEELEKLLRKKEDDRDARNEAVRQQWLASESRRHALESSFPAFERRVRQIFSSSGSDTGDEHHKLYILPMTAARLAQQAEETTEFEDLVTDICGIESPDLDYDPDAVSPSWVSAEFLPRLLWCSGFYSTVMSNEPTEDLQHMIIDRAPVLERDVVYLRPLGGCDFARDRFEVCNYPVVRMPAAELDELREPGKFEPRQKEIWALHEVVRSRSGCVDISRPGPAGERSDKASKVSLKRASRAGIYVDNYLLPLLVLTLYSDQRFYISSVLLSEPGWPLLRLPSNPSRGQTGYEVDQAALSKFECFVKMCEDALERCECWATELPNPVARRLGFSATPLWRPIGVAARHYLRSTFNSGEVLPGWAPNDPLFAEDPYSEMEVGLDAKMRETANEDELLHYVFCVEGLLTGSEKDAVSQKIATCAALIVGRNDDERDSIARFVKKAYSLRSEIVHGRTASAEIDLVQLRSLCQRLLGIVLSLVLDHDGHESLEETLRKLPLSEGLQRIVARSREKILDLISDSALLV